MSESGEGPSHAEIKPTEIDAAQLKESLAPLLAKEIPSRSLIEKYRPDINWFRNPKLARYSHHDTGHSALLSVLGKHVVGRELEANPSLQLNEVALDWASATHDAMRQSDTEISVTVQGLLDRELLFAKHGIDAGEWVVTEFPKIHPELDQETIALLSKINHYHGITPPPGIEREVELFRDIDRLDTMRPLPRRVGVPGTQFMYAVPDFISTRVKQKLIEHYDPQFHTQSARELYPHVYSIRRLAKQDLDKYKQDPFTAMLDATEEVGMIK